MNYWTIPVLVVLAVKAQCFQLNELHLSSRAPSSCSGKWLELKDTSTMCKYYDSNSAKNCGVSSAEKQLILDTHNRLRAGVSPSSKNMMKMYWNDDLAAVAQKWAKQCRSAHDTNENRQIPGWGKDIFVGQSWASGGLYDTWEKAIEMGWYGEVEYFNYGRTRHNGVVGHYTQVVRDEANLIGCGKCSCSSGPVYICNYYQGNSRDKAHPYASGSSCRDCKKCSNKLCDCGDKFCKNNGTLNSKTCECDCAGKWSGSDCGTYSCPASDGSGCGNWFHENDCERYFNVPDECPHMCGLCKGGSGGGSNGGDNNVDDCKDDHTSCADWAGRGECDKNPGYMLSNCKKSCQQCGGSNGGGGGGGGSCADDNDSCAGWASRGECNANPSYMHSHCKKSCNKC